MEKFYTPKEIAEMLQYSITHIYRLLNMPIADGGMPSLKFGKYRRIKESDLKKWLDSKYEE